MSFRRFLIILFLILTSGNIHLPYLALEYENKQDLKTSSKKNIDLNNDSYILGPGDKISIIFNFAPKLSGEYRILSNGSLPLPLIGNINIRNKNLLEVQNLLYEAFSEKLIRPDLNISLIDFRTRKISIIGEVNQPGFYTFESGIDDEFPTVIAALKKAGGVTSSTNLKEVKLIRKLPGDSNEKKYTTINLVNFILQGDQSQNLYLYDGDIIELSKATNNGSNFNKVSSSNLFPNTIAVNILGSVNRPGKIALRSNTPLVKAIMEAGGPTQWRTNRGNVELIRFRKNGTAIRKIYKINLLENISQKNPILQSGDIVKVNPTLLNNITTGVGALTEPLSGVLNALTLIKLLD